MYSKFILNHVGRDENMLSFSWALKTFLRFMKGKAPRTTLTSQNMCLKEVIATEIPETKHAVAKLSDSLMIATAWIVL
ncbi:hypothetical protein QYF36_026893 [Acer negundo]|nr:hypothetical protein QYF36_026893 [Acer negundo]